LKIRALDKYLSKTFLTHFLVALIGLLLIIYIFDTVELLRRAAKQSDINFEIVLFTSLMKLPQTGLSLFPFALFFSSIYTLWKLTRTYELIVIRSFGVSAWRFLLPIITTAFFIGIVEIGAINPAAAIMLARYEQLDNRYFNNKDNSINLNKTGIWLKQKNYDNESEEIILHAKQIMPNQNKFGEISVFYFNQNYDFLKRIDAKEAYLKDGAWQFNSAFENVLNMDAKPITSYTIKTDLSINKIESRFASPETINFWQLPKFISIVEKTGFSSTKLRIHFNSLLAQPWLFVGIVLISSAISMGMPRRSKTPLVLGIGIFAAFLLFFLKDVVQALGLAENLPIIIASFAPALISVFIGASALIYLEDG